MMRINNILAVIVMLVSGLAASAQTGELEDIAVMGRKKLLLQSQDGLFLVRL